MLLHAFALPQVLHPTPLRADSDTAVMLNAVRDAGGLTGAWRWFVGDWLLENGFYRPISSFSIALDYTLYGEAAWGFRLTNWLLMILTALGAFFLVRAYARLAQYPSPNWLALGVAVALSLQQTGLTAWLGNRSTWWFVAVATLFIGFRHGLQIPRFAQRGKPLAQRTDLASPTEVREPSPDPSRQWALLFLAIGALFWGFDRLLETHYTRLIIWVPSRTALLGTMFSVWAVYWLLRGASERRGGWLGLGGVFYLLALGSYEQPIMLVPIVGALAFWRRREWGAWGWKAFGTVALVGILVLTLRVSLLPTEPTRYQQQQLRSSLTGPLSAYLTELIPPAGQWQYWASVGGNLEILLVDKQGWDNLVGALLYLGVLGAFWRNRALLGGALVWHALTFLPMAFLHFFEHYMYLPQLGKTLFDVVLIAWGATRIQSKLP
ncbi:MAG: hypothetical protein CFK49_11495 [Armatimonadetes bacterium JP3_11]|nr:MAG: hypothetical protein CFK48_06470 [Armatimonadetes bacterium CP1_7O]OYT71047.1 MAG: hypothetical protein CFK49_11495 [Armatimonadetes bacterium JP3_11]RMH06433.1 MAG: hypothetical protein D6697_10570 [Armatimonadota bacterium]